MMDDRVEGTRRYATFLQTMKAVAWSFFGVRKGTDLERDTASLNPVHVVVAALIGVALFITVLILIVRSVVG